MSIRLLIDSGFLKMMSGLAVLHTTRIIDLVVRQKEEKCPTELMLCMKSKLPISNFSMFGCTVFMTKRDKDVSTHEPRALEGGFVRYTQGDHGFLVYVTNTSQVVAVRDMINKDSKVGSIPANTIARPTR